MPTFLRPASFLLAFLLFAAPAHANDGVFYAQGGTLFPVKETVLRLDKEVLKMRREDNWMAVEVNFEFFNPGSEKTVTVGFVTPPANGDVDEATAWHPQIRDFTVAVNGKAQAYQVARLQGTGFSLSEQRRFFGDDFVYHFEAGFKPGVNKVRHSYVFRGGSSVDTSIDFPYRLTTGNLWANGEIGDFTLEIEMGERALFTVPWSLHDDGRRAPWELLGRGKLAKAPLKLDEGNPLRAVYVGKGALRLKQEHFQPTHDLWVAVFNTHMEYLLWDPGVEKHAFAGMQWVLQASAPAVEDLAGLDDAQLRHLRNLPYARRGYVFNSPELQDFFAKMLWYEPLPQLRMEDIQLDAEEKALVAAVAAEEQRRKGL
jgi:hypothetical protein